MMINPKAAAVALGGEARGDRSSLQGRGIGIMGT